MTIDDQTVLKVYDHLCSVNGAWQPISPNDIREILTAALPFLQGVKVDVDALAQEIRRVDGKHNKGAGELAEALIPYLSAIEVAPSPRAQALEEGVKLAIYELNAWMKCATEAGLCVTSTPHVVDHLQEALSSQPVADGWLPIETAPTDETLFLAYCQPDEDFPDGRMMIWKGSIFAFQKNPTPRHLQFPATHWRPLPSAPSQEVAG